MILITHPSDLEQQQQYLLAMFFYLWMINEKKAAKEFGEQFDRLYKYDSDNADNGINNIHNALNFDWDED